MKGTKVYKYSISGNYVCSYESLASAAIGNGILYTSISNAISINGQAGGFQWRKEKFDSISAYDLSARNKKSSESRKKKVDMFSLSGEYIKSFDSALDASIQTGFPRSGISGACSGKYDFSSGHIWRYSAGFGPRKHKSKGRKSLKKYCDLSLSKKIKARASASAREALKKGLINRMPCEKCGALNNKMQMHHEDYSKPLDIVWLCRPCHVDRHNELKKMGINSLPAI